MVDLSALGFRKKKDSTPKTSGLLIEKLEPDIEIVEEYLVNPFAKVFIVEAESEGYKYFVQETTLNPEEQEACDKLKSILSKELEAPEELESDVLSYILTESEKVAQKYKKSLGEFNETSWRNIFYHVVRDLAGYEEVNTLFKKMNPDVVAIEEVYVSQNAKTTLRLGHARGVILLSAVNNMIEISEYAPREIKQAVCGNGNASKEQIQWMVANMLNLDVNKLTRDAADALAVAICHGLRCCHS